MTDTASSSAPTTPTSRLVLASVVGTAIEFYDFYIYATASVLVLPALFFPARDERVGSLLSLATFGIAFVARPFGSILFGHFGDRAGRKSTLVASLLTMGLSTTLIGVLPTFGAVGIAAPLALCVLRMGQGIGLGGEWGGAALVATENAPPGRRAWFGMFPQLGPPIGFLLANGLFLILVRTLTTAQFSAWGWRIPFLVSAVLVVVGLAVRRTVGETPAFLDLTARREKARVPIVDLFRNHGRNVALGSLAIVTSYANFYIATLFTLDYGTKYAGLSRGTLLGLLCVAILAMAVMTLASARLADRFGARRVLVAAAAVVVPAGFATSPLLGSHTVTGTLVFLVLELGLTGLVFAPIGSLLPSLFPPRVRYTGASMAYNVGGILGASWVPYAAGWLVRHGGLVWVGYYVSLAGLVSLIAAALTNPQDSD